ncbi:MAG: hypothetical protein GX773_07345 [Chloroflexi bacterium]|nr:hypothetical protein [Chloroflexota bacterium]
MPEQKLIGVQFKPVGKTYHFALPEDMVVATDDYVIVNTARGKQIGKISTTDVNASDHQQEVQTVERKATPRDLILRDMIKEKEVEAVEKARNFLENSKYDGVKAIDAEYSFDSSRLTLFLSYENSSDFNMRSFIREAAPMYPDTRLEIRQVGPRDVAKEISGLGACGIEKRCCSRFLTEFSSISIRMAKSQNVSLSPSEITGICGRLRCCLAYEHDLYEEARKLLPKQKKTVQTPLGEGRVIQVLPLTDSVIVDIPQVGRREITRIELETGKMEEQVPVIPAYDESASTDSDVEMVRFDNVGSPPKSGETPSESPRARSRSSNNRSSRGKTNPKTPEDSLTTDTGKENSSSQKRGGRGRSSSRRGKRDPINSDKANNNAGKNN